MLEVTSLVIATPNTHIRMQPDGLAWCSRSYARGIFLCGGTYAEVVDPVGGCGTPRGGAAFGGNRAHAAGSTDAASALAAPYRASAARGVVPVGSLVALVPPTYRRAIFSAFQLTAAIISAITFPTIV